MKHLLWLLLLPSLAFAQTWSGTASLSASTVAVGASTAVTVQITAGASDTGVVVSVAVVDANGQFSPANLTPAMILQAGQVATLAPVTETVNAGAPNGTYHVVVSASDDSGNLLFKNELAASFTVTGGVAAVQPPARPSPPCYPILGGANTTLTLIPASYPAWLTASNPTFILTWFCPSATDPTGFTGYTLFGYRSEILPNWATLTAGPKSVVDAAWSGTNFNDVELTPAANAQLQATWPQPLKTTGTTVYYVIQQPDKYVPVPVGTAPVGTACNRSQSVDGMYGVPVATVTWYGSVKPLSVVAPCI